MPQAKVVEAQAAVQLHRTASSNDEPPAAGMPPRSTPSDGNPQELPLEVNLSTAAAADGVGGDTGGDKSREPDVKRQAAERQDAERRDAGPTERREIEDEETESAGAAKGESGSTEGGDGGDGGGSGGGGGGGDPGKDADAKRKEEEAAALSSHLQVIAMHMVRRRAALRCTRRVQLVIVGGRGVVEEVVCRGVESCKWAGIWKGR